MTTKADIIDGAYSLMRISGITVVPSGADVTLALRRLEDMAEEFEGRNIVTGYNFENEPDSGSLHNLERKLWYAYKINLAVRLLPDFGKDIPPLLASQQEASLKLLVENTASIRPSSAVTTKASLINGAYSLMRVSGIIQDPSGEELALIQLENMAAEFFGRNINTGYNFENEPDSGSLHNLERMFWFAYEANLAVRLLSDFGKQVPQTLLVMQQSTFSFLSSVTAPIKTTQYPSRMPRGEANTRRTYGWRRFNTPIAEAPLSSETVTMFIGDVKNFTESFAAYLASGETISSYTITADTGLTISADTNATPLITYTITATGLSDGNSVSLLEVKIIITTSASRILTRIKNFELQTSDVIN